MSIRSNVEIKFEDFYYKYFSKLFEWCVMTFAIEDHSAEDIVQNAFIALYQSCDSLETHTEPGLLVWMRKTIKYMVYSFNRQNARDPKIVDLDSWMAVENEQQYNDTADILDDAADDEGLYLEYLNTVRDELTPKQRAIFDCIIIEKNNVATAALILHMKENTVKVALKRLRRHIRKNILPKLKKVYPQD